MTENPTQYAKLANGGARASPWENVPLMKSKLRIFFAFKPCVKTFAEKLAFYLAYDQTI